MMSVEALAPPPQSSEQRATKTFYKSLRRRHTSWCQLKMTVLLGGNSHHLSKSGMWPDQRKKWSLYVLQHSVQAILAKQTSKSWLRKFSQCKCNLVVTSSVTVYPWVLIKYRKFSIQCLPIVNFIQFYSIGVGVDSKATCSVLQAIQLGSGYYYTPYQSPFLRNELEKELRVV